MTMRTWALPVAIFLLQIRVSISEVRRARAEDETSNTQPPASPRCEASGKTEIKIDCEYDVTDLTGKVADQSTSASSTPRIFLKHALIEFGPKHESHMQIQLTLINQGKIKPTESRTVYVEFDDETSQNHIRRPLPHVDLQKLEPGIAITFADQFLAPALRPGRYFVKLWIPDSNPTYKFDTAYNLLLSNPNIPDPASGLNLIATVTVDKPDAPASSLDHGESKP